MENKKAKFGYGPYGTYTVTTQDGKIKHYGTEEEAIKALKQLNK